MRYIDRSVLIDIHLYKNCQTPVAYFEVLSCNMHENSRKNYSVDTVGAQGVPPLETPGV